MSLTSYRAAPPRANRKAWRTDCHDEGPTAQKRRRSRCDSPQPAGPRREKGFVLGWPGNDLLSRVLRHSTISAEAFNGRVRDGIGFRHLAPVTGPAKDKRQAPSVSWVPACAGIQLRWPR